MLQTTLKITALSVVSLTLLFACGGAANKLEDAEDRREDAEDAEEDRKEDEREDFAASITPIASVADRVASEHTGGEFSNNNTPNITNDDTFDATYIETQDTFSVRAGATANTLIMTVDGVDHTLSKNAQSYYSGTGEIFLSDNLPNLSATITDIEEVVAGTHATVQGMFVYYGTNANDYDSGASDFDLDYTGGYATIGTRTTAPVVASQTATATYNGTMQLLTSQTEVTGNNSINSSGSLAMTVDFNADTVSGTGTISISGGDGIITFGSAPISGNGFAGTFTMNPALLTKHSITDTPTGNYAGNFFGPAANDLAGVMRIQGKDDRETVRGLGGFRADRETQ